MTFSFFKRAKGKRAFQSNAKSNQIKKLFELRRAAAFLNKRMHLSRRTDPNQIRRPGDAAP
jgi:hypothetical protein